MIRTAVMTCWAAPMRDGLRGGKALWSLAALCARQYFDRLVLFADELGEQWLCRGLGLPFDRVERLRTDDSYQRLWALGKLHAYRTMAERDIPFVHVDGDVCLLDPLPARILSASVLAEMAEHWTPPQSVMNAVDLPELWERNSERMWNCGIFGGTNTAAIYAWSSEVLGVVERNKERWASINGTFASMMLEQWSLSFAFDPGDIAALLPFAGAESGYVHLKEGKFSSAWRSRVERELIARFPERARRLAVAPINYQPTKAVLRPTIHQP